MNRKTFLGSLLSIVGLGLSAKESPAKESLVQRHYKDIVLEKELSQLDYPQELGGYRDHQKDMLVARVYNLRRTNEGIVGDIISNFDLKGLYPSLGLFVFAKDENGHILSGHVEMLGLCKGPNVDPAIRPLGEPNFIYHY